MKSQRSVGYCGAECNADEEPIFPYRPSCRRIVDRVKERYRLLVEG